MRHLNLTAYWAVLRPVLVLLLLGLPAMTGVCLWQTVTQHKRGDEALSRSWADASKSFAGMMVASWVVAYGGYRLVQYMMAALAEMQRTTG